MIIEGSENERNFKTQRERGKGRIKERGDD